MKININSGVRLKLNELGIEILRSEHYNLYKRINRNSPNVKIPLFELSLDEEGYHKMQIHSFMNTFGSYMTIGSQIPFDAEVIFENDFS